jgi:hypothetical protein
MTSWLVSGCPRQFRLMDAQEPVFDFVPLAGARIEEHPDLRMIHLPGHQYRTLQALDERRPVELQCDGHIQCLDAPRQVVQCGGNGIQRRQCIRRRLARAIRADHERSTAEVMEELGVRPVQVMVGAP